MTSSINNSFDFEPPALDFLEKKKNSGDGFDFDDFYWPDRQNKEKSNINKSIQESKSNKNIYPGFDSKLEQLLPVRSKEAQQFSREPTPTFMVPKQQKSFNFTFKKENLANTQGLKTDGSEKEKTEQQIEQLRRQLQYYIKEAARYEYQTNKLKLKQVEMIRLDDQFQFKIESINPELNMVRERVQQQKSYQQSLIKTIEQCTIQRKQLIEQMKAQTFERSLDPTDAELQIYGQLEAIEKQMQQIQNNNSEESQLLIKQPSLAEHPAAQLPQIVYQLSLAAKDVKFVYNVKLASLKSRWILLEDQHLQIGIIYQSQQDELQIHMHIGNKNKHQLTNFCVEQSIENGEIKVPFKNQRLAGKNFLNTRHVSRDFIGARFINFEIRYQIENKSEFLKGVVPICFLHFGEFQVITPLMFAKRWKDSRGVKRIWDQFALDHELIGNVLDIKKYLTNLVELSSKTHQKYLGGQFNFQNAICKEVLIKFKQKSNLLRLIVKTPDQVSRRVVEVVGQWLRFIFTI